MGMVELTNVTKKFPSSHGEIMAVNSISFNVKKREVLGILGPNGAGKTTTLRMIATIYKPDEGIILVDGMDVVKNPMGIKKKIAYMTQEPDLPPALSVRDYIIYHFRFRGLRKGAAKEHCDHVLELFELKGHSHKKPFQLSTGLKRRVQLACALSSNAPIIFLDEPTAGIDPRSKRNTWEFIKEKLKDSGMTVLLTSHDLYEIEYLADRVIIMDRGRIVAEGSPIELKKKFGKTVRVILEEPVYNFDLLMRGLLDVGSVKNVIPLDENSFEVQLKSLEYSINDILQAVTSHGLRIRDIFTTTANFEDVYLDIIGG
jgi:ABC-2 type transport system ATP-binding protein